MQELGGGGGDFVDGGEEGGLVGFRGFVKAGNFADELERGGANFVGSYGRFEIEKRLDAAAHEAPAKIDFRER